MVDWDLKTSLDGLYAAGGSIFGSGAHASAAVSGRYTGRKAAVYAKTKGTSEIDRKQVEAEKNRVYLPLKQKRSGIGWKELNAGIARVMQDNCGQYKNEETLRRGLDLLKDIRETEAAKAWAATPHELGRLLECYSIISCGEVVINASLARKASSAVLGFKRLDYPDIDPPEWKKLLAMKLRDSEVTVKEVPLDYFLKPPYAPSFEENYQQHCGLD